MLTKNILTKLLALAATLLIGISVTAQKENEKPAAAQSAAQDNRELARLMAEDQADRTPPPGKSIDWDAVAPRDKARLARAKEMYAGNQLHTGNDYFNAALILQHSDTPDDYLLAHEMCVVAISLGNMKAKWLAAASEDRFLMTIGRPQRFGTQFRGEQGNIKLYTMGTGVTDELRRALNVPSLEQAKGREAELNKKR